jgi:hypothetical protein
MGAEYDIVIDKGATFIKTITWKNSGIPIDITGYTAIFTIKPSPSSDETLLVLDTDSTADGSITIDGTAGEIEIDIDATCTEDLAFDLSYYDLKLSSDDDPPVVTKLLRGRVTLNE